MIPDPGNSGRRRHQTLPGSVTWTASVYNAANPGRARADRDHHLGVLDGKR